MNALQTTDILKIKENMKKQFLADDRVWVIAYSSGKDSSTVLHLTMEILIELKKEGIRAKKVYVMSSDTGVEMPIIEAYHFNKMREISQLVKRENLNVEVKLVQPEDKNSFFVKLLGTGLASPTQSFRWCTQRLKIDPITAYLKSIIDKSQSIIMVLGTRLDESVARAESLNKRIENERALSIHPELADTYMYSPIKYLSTNMLWHFISTNKAPWGDHSEMMDLYEKGSAEADCNIVMHPGQEGCNKTRFGCFTCTLISEDSSMAGMIANGKTWLKPFYNFRLKILKYRFDHSKRREKTSFGTELAGAFLLDVRKELLEDVFKMENEVREEYEALTGKRFIISENQILLINEEHQKHGDFKNDVLKLANRYGRNFKIVESKLNDSLSTLCKDNELNPLFFEKLLNINYKHRHSLKRIGIKNEQDELIRRQVQVEVHNDN